MKKICICILLALVAAVVATAATPPCLMAQEPTPTPNPILEIVVGDEGTFGVEKTIDYGEAGIIVMLVVIVGVQLINLSLKVAEWITE